ncbi:50S ribosomal protein L4 [Chloroflexota bacterium]
MQISVYNRSGQEVEQIDLDETVFGLSVNQAVVHQAMVRQLANARTGTASTKTRGQVAGSTKKMYRQKHTGNARAGSRRSPLRRGGGVTFGPQPRSYKQAMPKKMRRLALKCMLSAKVADEELRVIESLELAEPSTKDMLSILKALDIKSSVLVVTAEPRANVIKSARNIQKVKTLPANLLNVIDLLSHKNLLMTVDAARLVEVIWGKKQEAVEATAS